VTALVEASDFRVATPNWSQAADALSRRKQAYFAKQTSPVISAWKVAPPSVVLPLMYSTPVAPAKLPVLVAGSIRAISLNKPATTSNIPTLRAFNTPLFDVTVKSSV
jgi:hypothetical protein